MFMSNDHKNVIQKASDLLVFRRFDECLETCLSCVEQTRDCIEIEKNAVICEGICLVAIQAYAELNRWTEVLPFVTQLYSGLEDCPATVSQACLLLHARMKDYPTCTAITNIWLRNKNNYAHPEYHILLELYIGKVLIPLNKWTDIPAFIDACPGLQAQAKEQYKKQVTSLERRREQAEIDKIHELDAQVNDVDLDDRTASVPHALQSNSKSGASDNKHSQKSRDVSSSHNFMVYARKVALWAKANLPFMAWNVVKNLALLSVVLYLLLARSNIDMLSKEGWLSIWALVVNLWKSMFTPYHLLKQSNTQS